ncbi:hypothetical protein [Halalkalibacter lacteus]|uniref:hypothetical protein n=1 Tax=Halalkalibacter lacteus TaxID=3090663 RepID=UPI002FCC34C8
MATQKVIFTYDDIEDKEVHTFFSKLPKGDKSKHIRRALRAYVTGQSAFSAPPSAFEEEEHPKSSLHSKKTEKEPESDFTDLPDDLFNR